MPDPEEHPEIERGRAAQHDRKEEGDREKAHARWEHRADVVIRARRGWPALAARCLRWRGRGRCATRAEEVRLGVKAAGVVSDAALGRSEHELVVVDVALAQQRERE